MDKVIKDIRCNACNCVHHADDYKCTAGHIEIGNTSACLIIQYKGKTLNQF